MNFSTPDKVASVIDNMYQAGLVRAQNRTLIVDLFNGLPPYTKKEAEDNKIFVNVNWKDGPTILHAARRQYENAFTKTGKYMNILIDNAPADKQQEWSMIVTRELNKVMKRSLPYLHTQREKFASVVLHGPGPQMWEDEWTWKPHFVSVEDLQIPTDTEITFSNLTYFNVKRRMTPAELYRKTFAKGDNMDPGWNKKAVAKILDDIKDVNQNSNQENWSQNPERMAELYKQNSTYYDSDAVPKIWVNDFYYYECDGDGEERNGWHRCMIPDLNQVVVSSDMSSKADFIYKSKKPVADELGQILHVQFGDGNNQPPFMYHSVRSLGFQLYDVLHMMNRLQCQFTQHVFEQMLMLFRSMDPSDHSRISRVDLHNFGIIPDGLAIVPAGERYTVDNNLVQTLGAQFKQKLSEASSIYTQDANDGTNKEKTATEVISQMNSINALTASMLQLAYVQEQFAYEEIARRFANPNSLDMQCKKFRERCRLLGVPEKCLRSEFWTVTPDQVLGAGNKQLEVAQATQLLGLSVQLDPSAQQKIKRNYVLALTDNPAMANDLVPEEKTNVTDAVHDAELAFGTLMQGVPMQVHEGLNHVEQVATLLRLMGGKIQQINQNGGVGRPEDIAGFEQVVAYINAHLQIMAQDEANTQLVKQLNDILTKELNEIRGFVQRQQEAAQKAQQQGGGLDPEVAAGIQADLIKAQSQAKIKEASAAQKELQKQVAFTEEQARRNLANQAEIRRGHARTASEIQNQQVRTDVATTEQV